MFVTFIILIIISHFLKLDCYRDTRAYILDPCIREFFLFIFVSFLKFVKKILSKSVFYVSISYVFPFLFALNCKLKILEPWLFNFTMKYYPTLINQHLIAISTTNDKSLAFEFGWSHIFMRVFFDVESRSGGRRDRTQQCRVSSVHGPGRILDPICIPVEFLLSAFELASKTLSKERRRKK